MSLFILGVLFFMPADRLNMDIFSYAIVAGTWIFLALALTGHLP